ncbi:MAG: hypothetical protein ABI759_31795 [Candidatus Solibacter sp.]
MRTPKPSQEILDQIAGVDRTEYDAILQDLQKKHAPADIDERCLVESLAYDVWTSRRMVLFRTLCPYDPETPGLNAMLDLAARRLSNAARNYTRTLKMLTRFKKSRPAIQPPCLPVVETGEWVN